MIQASLSRNLNVISKASLLKCDNLQMPWAENSVNLNYRRWWKPEQFSINNTLLIFAARTQKGSIYVSFPKNSNQAIYQVYLSIVYVEIPQIMVIGITLDKLLTKHFKMNILWCLTIEKYTNQIIHVSIYDFIT